MGVLDTVRRYSLATRREHPVAPDVAVTGTYQVRVEQLPFVSKARLELRDITEDVMARVKAMGIREGLMHLQSLHTTCAVIINESQDALSADILQYLESAVDAGTSWRHDNPELSECDRQNTDSHLRALLLSPALPLQVSGGELVLGQWQRILVVELDGARARTLRLQVMGVA